MAAAKEIRTKIRSIKNTQKITRAMEMVAASKMRKVQDRMRRAQPYAKKISEVIARVARGHSEYRHPYLEVRDAKRVGIIIVTTDRGLCGGLNTNLLRTALTQVKTWKDEGKEIDFCLVGTKAEAFFRRIGGKVLAQVNHLGDAPQLSDLIGTIKVMLDAYKKNEIDALYLCSNEFINTMRQVPQIQQVLPVVPSVEQEIQHYWDYIYEPDNAKELLENLLKRYIESQIYRGVIENIACEQAARMLAMKNATDNAADFIEQLELAYHKARQSAITRELSEIVAGAAVV
jgi:F-type H+-transporting ATPase subunit gamma